MQLFWSSCLGFCKVLICRQCGPFGIFLAIGGLRIPPDLPCIAYGPEFVCQRISVWLYVQVVRAWPGVDRALTDPSSVSHASPATWRLQMRRSVAVSSLPYRFFSLRIQYDPLSHPSTREFVMPCDYWLNVSLVHFSILACPESQL